MKLKRTLRHEQLLIYACTGIVSCLFGFLLINTLAPINLSDAVERVLEVKVNNSSVLSLELNTNALNFNITPTSAGYFESKKVTATVTTNSSAGYELYMSSDDNANAMISLTSESTIASDFNSAVTSATMASNEWGYGTDNTNFSKIPLLNSPAQLRNLDHAPSSAEKTNDVYFGMKIDTALSSGTYTKNIMFTAVAHATPVATINNLTNMQQMTTAICTATDEGGTKTLTDTRDNKTYSIFRAKDGKCWMSDDLAIDGTVTGGGDRVLTPRDSDVDTSFTVPVAVTSSAGWVADSYDVPQIYYVSSTDTYYYNFAAASAGTITGADNTTPDDYSICPRGWRLPTYSEYATLLSAHSITSDQTGYEIATTAPFNFSLVGNISASGSFIGMPSGAWWTLTYSYNSTHRSILSIMHYSETSYAVMAAEAGNPRNYGLPIRCVSR